MGCLRGDVLQALPAGSVIRNLDVFHDREGFTTVWGSKGVSVINTELWPRSNADVLTAREGQARPASKFANFMITKTFLCYVV